MSPTPSVRLLTHDDHEAVADLLAHAYAPLLLGPDDPYLARLRDVATRAAQAQVWVATLDGVVAGSVTWCPAGSALREIGRADEGEFRMLAVDPASQRRGVAGALIAHCLSLARAEGRRAVVLSSLAEQRAAHRRYAAHGFVRVPERDWSPAAGTDLLAFARDC